MTDKDLQSSGKAHKLSGTIWHRLTGTLGLNIHSMKWRENYTKAGSRRVESERVTNVNKSTWHHDQCCWETTPQAANSPIGGG